MKELDLSNIFRKLIENYGKVNGIKTFEVKKIGNKFIHTDINENLLNSITIPTFGKTLCDLPINKDAEERMESFYERAWGGEKLVNYQVFHDNEIISVFSLEPIIKDGHTDRLEGHCVLLSSKEFVGLLNDLYSPNNSRK
jgi:hypothetical protein